MRAFLQLAMRLHFRGHANCSLLPMALRIFAVVLGFGLASAASVSACSSSDSRPPALAQKDAGSGGLGGAGADAGTASGGASGASGIGGATGGAGGIGGAAGSGSGGVGASGSGGIAGFGGNSGAGGGKQDAGSDASDGGATCSAGTADCDGFQANGCEAKLLTDSAHCGSCGNSCLGGQCVGGTCAPLLLAAKQADARGVAIQDGVAYWANPGSGKVVSCPLSGCGGSPKVIASLGPKKAFFVATDSTHIYFNNNQDSEIWRCNLSGCSAGQKVWKSAANLPTLSKPTRLAIDAKNVYWHSQADAVHRAAKSGSAAVAASGTGNHGAVASNGSQLAWTERTHHRVRVCDLPTCSKKSVLASKVNVPGAIAIDGKNVYFGTTQSKSSKQDALVGHVPFKGGSPNALVKNLKTVADVVAHGQYVYFVEGASNGRLLRVPKKGGALEVIADKLNNPATLAIDSDFVVVTVAGAGQVWRYSLPGN